MSKKLKIAIIVILVILILIPIMPYPWVIVTKDGGSKTWKSLTWELHHYHKLMPVGERNDGIYFTGWRIKIFGYTLRDDYVTRKQ